MEVENNGANICKSCGSEGSNKYCSSCGQAFALKRISMAGLMHDVFHVFTHLDKGFGYTVKRLLLTPGKMQRMYIEGDRARHQKPFSMFLICATVSAILRYWTVQFIIKYYNVGDLAEANYFREYTVVFFVVFLPIFTAMIYLLFPRSGYNYAEVGVFNLYLSGVFLLVATFVFLFKAIFPTLDTAYIELPFLLVYTTVSFINFFPKQPAWIVAIKSILLIAVVFYLIQLAEDYLITLM